MNIKSQTEKINEIKTIYLKLRQFGLTKIHPDIKTFQDIVNKYIFNEESYSGKIRIRDTDRILEYILPKTNKHQCNVMLRYKPS